jgi:hypothetical protein
MIVPTQLALKTRTNFGCAASLATLDKLNAVQKSKNHCGANNTHFSCISYYLSQWQISHWLPVSPPISDTSLTHVTRLAAHPTTPPTPTATGQSFIMTLYYCVQFIKFITEEQKPMKS